MRDIEIYNILQALTHMHTGLLGSLTGWVAPLPQPHLMKMMMVMMVLKLADATWVKCMQKRDMIVSFINIL